MSGILETLRSQHAAYVSQRNQTQVNFQQLSGAIHVLEELIKSETEKEQQKDNIQSIDNENVVQMDNI